MITEADHVMPRSLKGITCAEQSNYHNGIVFYYYHNEEHMNKSCDSIVAIIRLKSLKSESLLNIKNGQQTNGDEEDPKGALLY